jgi:hypothetical protein
MMHGCCVAGVRLATSAQHALLLGLTVRPMQDAWSTKWSSPKVGKTHDLSPIRAVAGDFAGTLVIGR